MKYPLGTDGKKLDQIEEVIIKQLKDSPDSRRAVATTLVPEIDAFSKESPCITQLQALQSRGNFIFWRLFEATIFSRPRFRTLLVCVFYKKEFARNWVLNWANFKLHRNQPIFTSKIGIMRIN